MCGIAGYFNTHLDRERLDLVLETMRHRGPDSQTFTVNGDVGLLHTRLSILELSELGAQPYSFQNLMLIFNGEIYNYKEIGEELKKFGYSFVSHSDTEVLIKAFHLWRERCVDRFIGMFAFAVYDKLSDELFIFRDRLGVKPLYYSWSNGVLFFASELKVFEVFGVTKELNLHALRSYFRFGYVSGDQSIFKAVSKLEAGHFLKIGRQKLSKHRYWHLTEGQVQNRKEDDWVDELETLLISAFRYRMVSDVPVGIFLSGGIDSSILAAVLQKHVGDLHSFTIGFAENNFDESEHARKVAEHLRINHTEKILELGEARELLVNFYSIYDEPFADTSGIPVACVTQLAKAAGMKVVLSADGGDELFGGYLHYQKAYSLYRRLSNIPLKLRKQFARCSRIAAPHSFREKIVPFNFHHRLSALEELLVSGTSTSFFEAYLANQSMDEIAHLIGTNDMNDSHINDDNGHPLTKMMGWDLKYYLPDDLLVKVDRATMFYGIECREPLLDHRLVEFAARLPIDLKFRNGDQKYIMKKLLRRYLPSEYFERKKRGFSIPIFEWFSADLDSMFNEYLSEENLEEVRYLNPAAVKKELEKYFYYKKFGKSYNIEKMWRLLSFMMWHKKWA